MDVASAKMFQIVMLTHKHEGISKNMPGIITDLQPYQAEASFWIKKFSDLDIAVPFNFLREANEKEKQAYLSFFVESGDIVFAILVSYENDLKDMLKTVLLERNISSEMLAKNPRLALLRKGCGGVSQFVRSLTRKKSC